jgi:hypothetical protein
MGVIASFMRGTSQERSVILEMRIFSFSEDARLQDDLKTCVSRMSWMCDLKDTGM